MSMGAVAMSSSSSEWLGRLGTERGGGGRFHSKKR
jgi:hypothetical protein